MEEFMKVIRETIQLFHDFLPLEETKLKHVQEQNLSGLENCMTQEQAVVMKLRGLENKRAAAQKKLGWEGKTFREILDLVPEDRKGEFSALYEQLTLSMNVFRETNDSAMKTVKVHLRQIDKAIESKKGDGTYSPDGQPPKTESYLTNQKV